ncbi:MAG: hypothetical protein Q9214_001751 [Letrouitia sp. 1 TL-2023]
MELGSDNDALAPSSLRISTENHNHPYALSIASSASSSTSSVFSLDAPSSQSSVSSSSTNWENEQDNQYYLHQPVRQPIAVQRAADVTIASYASKPGSIRLPISQAVAPESRQHPRRTQRLANQNGGPTAAGPKAPPTLVRQCERKDNFVESLVDTTTQMIETIWPLSVLSCGRDTSVDGKDKNLIGLRTFVQEVLRRSKTSYSTLQVALYYLVLIQSCLPKHDFTMEQREDTPSCRAMQCGRRMFLAALILASKYLQDRNFSSRAWSKISGLKACEINMNEMAFLTAVGWKLHIPEPVFQRWTKIVLRYSPSASSPTSPRSSPLSTNMWKAIIPQLTPDLALASFGDAKLSPSFGRVSPSCIKPPSGIDFKETLWSESNQPTPTNAQSIPKTLEPTPRACNMEPRIPPAPLPRFGGLLPTPEMTPQTERFSNSLSTPAVGAEGLCPRRSSMSIAMENAHNACMARMTLDMPTPPWRPAVPQAFPTPTRRSSLARSGSSISSPETMISDRSTRSSRSSSISSVASSTGALSQPRPGGLAAQATCRRANMQLSGIQECQPTILRSSPAILSWEVDSQNVSPEAVMDSNMNYFNRNNVEVKLPSTAASAYNKSTHEAAVALRDLALNRQGLKDQEGIRTTMPRKRERPKSMDLSMQDSVRDLLRLGCLGDITNGRTRDEDDGIVLPDCSVADSFIVPKDGENSLPEGLDKKFKPLLVKEGPRKRACATSMKEESRKLSQFITEQTMRQRPGMWEGVI